MSPGDRRAAWRPALPTVLFVHGAFHGAWCWERVAALVEAEGVPTSAVELPFTGFDDDVAELLRSIEATAGPVVVCAHSYGGRVLTVAAGETSRVDHLVYVASLVLSERQRPSYEAATSGRRPVDFASLDFESVRARYYHDCAEADVRDAFARLRPVAARPHGTQAMGPEPWRRLPSTYVACSLDRVVDPQLQREMATNTTYSVEIASGHSPFISRPALLADVVVTIATSGRPDRGGAI